MNDEERGKSCQGKRDFWRAWRQERRRLWDEMDSPPGGGHDKHGHHKHGRHRRGPHGSRPFPPRQQARYWREFFHDYMGAWPEDHWAFSGRRFSPWQQGMDEFNPFVASILSKGGGLLPLYVMYLLSQQPRYGNEVMEKITERTGGQWVANPGAIYPLMTMLEEQGLIAGEWEDSTKRTIRIYRLTEAGHKELTRLKAVVKPKLVEAVEVMQGLAQDLNGNEDEPEDNF